MAEEIVVYIRCDVGTGRHEADTGRVQLAYCGKAVELDLCAAHRTEFENFLLPVMVSGREVALDSLTPGTRGRRKHPYPEKISSAKRHEILEWAELQPQWSGKLPHSWRSQDDIPRLPKGLKEDYFLHLAPG